MSKHDQLEKNVQRVVGSSFENDGWHICYGDDVGDDVGDEVGDEVGEDKICTSVYP